MNYRFGPLRPAVIGVALAATLTPAAAQPAPAVQVVVNFAAGGGLDATARKFSQGLAQLMSQPVVVVNRDGAAGTIGLQAAARARADGITLAFTPAVSVTSEPHRHKDLNYTLASFRPVCQVFENIFMIAVPKESPYRNLADLLANARAHPGRVSYGTSGIGSIPHLGASDIEATARIDLTHVPYRGDGPMLQDLLGSRLNFGAVLGSSVSELVAAGSLRLIAAFSDRRHPGFPEVPTLTEAGVPVVQLSFGGLLAPARTPPAVVAKLQGQCEQVTKSPDFLKWAAQANQVIAYADSASFQTRLQRDSMAKLATLKRLNMTP